MTSEKMQGHAWEVRGVGKSQCRTCGIIMINDDQREVIRQSKCGVYPLEPITTPASHDAVEALPQMTDRQMFNIAFNLSAEFGPEFTEANREFGLAAIHEYRTVTPACFEKEMRRFDSERDNLLSDVRVSHATIATLTAEVARLTGELAEAREIIDGYRAQSLRYKASMDECERLRGLLAESVNSVRYHAMMLGPAERHESARHLNALAERIIDAALSAGEKT